MEPQRSQSPKQRDPIKVTTKLEPSKKIGLQMSDQSNHQVSSTQSKPKKFKATYTKVKVIEQAQSFVDEMSSQKNLTTFGYQFYKHMKVVDVEFIKGVLGKVFITFRMQPHMFNGHGVGHGGALATLCDTIPYVAIHGFDNRKLVTAKLTTEFLNQTPMDVDLMMESVVFKIGLKNAYADFTLINTQTKEILVKGSGVFAFVEMPKL
eukprot:403351360